MNANNSTLLYKYVFTLENPYEAELKANVNIGVKFAHFQVHTRREEQNWSLWVHSDEKWLDTIKDNFFGFQSIMEYESYLKLMTEKTDHDLNVISSYFTPP